MCRKLSVALTISFVLYAQASLFAQNTPIYLNYQDNLLLKRMTFSQYDLGKNQNFSPTPMDLTSQALIIDYEKSILPFTKPIYTLIKNKDLIHEYLYNLKIKPIGNKQKAIKKLKLTSVDRKIFNALYNQPKVDEKKLIRLAWKKVFGLDVWYPYYKAKEIEDWIGERVSVKVYGFKGKPTFKDDQILYVFRKTF